MKILYMCWSLRKTAPITVLLNIIKYIDRNKFEPYILTIAPEKSDSYINAFKKLGVTIDCLNLKSVFGIFRVIYKIRKIVSKIKPDIVNVQCYYSILFGCLFLPEYLKTVILHCDYDIDYRLYYGKINGWIMSGMEDFLLLTIKNKYACSEYLASILNNKKCFNVNFVNNGIDTEKFKPTNKKEELRVKLNLPLDKKIFIWSALHYKRKDPSTLIDAIKNMQNNNTYFIICGDGELFPQMQKLTRGLKNVLMTGNVKNIEEYLQASDYYISTSLSEGLPLSVLEGLACGLPAILSDIPQHKMLFDYNLNIGKLFQTKNSDDLLHKIDEILLEDKENLHENCIQLIKGNFTAEIMSQKYQMEYEKIIKIVNKGGNKCS